MPPPLVSGPSQGLERKASRLAGKRRISEPFRVYAAKSADEMGGALRSLPLAASKPFEVCAFVSEFDVTPVLPVLFFLCLPCLAQKF